MPSRGILEHRQRTGGKRITVIDLSAAGNSAIMCRERTYVQENHSHLPGDRRLTPWRASTVFRGVFFYAMKHGGSVRDSTERGKIAGGFLNAWNGGRYSGADGEQQRSNGGRRAILAPWRALNRSIDQLHHERVLKPSEGR